MKRIILDCDPGMDDSMAIVMAVKAHALELLAVTTVNGNYPVETTSANARKMLELLQRTDYSCGAGSGKAPGAQPAEGPVYPRPGRPGGKQPARACDASLRIARGRSNYRTCKEIPSRGHGPMYRSHEQPCYGHTEVAPKSSR